MKTKVLLLLLVALVAYTEAEYVVDMTAAFEENIRIHEIALVKFYAPWCGHCKRLAPEFEEAAGTLIKHDPPVVLADVDCTADSGKGVCSKYGVTGYPTLKIFRHGEVSGEYGGARDADGIVQYMKTLAGPSSKEIKSKKDFEAVLARDESVVVGFFKEKDSALHQAYQKVADKERENYSFYHTHDAEVIEDKKFDDKVVVIRAKKYTNKFEDSEVVFDGAPDDDAIRAFLSKNFFGLVGHRTRDNQKLFDSPLLVAYYDVDYEKNPKGTNYWRNRIMKALKKHAGKIVGAVSSRKRFASEVDDFGFDSGDAPAIGIRDEKFNKYRMEGEFSIENLEKFVKDYLDGKLLPHLKSEKVPEDNDGPVKVAVARNFDDLVLGADKDVLIEFYAPWCGHCKKLAPVLEELGRELEGEDVIVVKMDATANDTPQDFQVQGYPTLYWLPKNAKSSPARYEGGRELKDFVKYIAKHATDELKKYDRSGEKRDAKSEL
ncbi:protein disulfide-isomerase A3 [Galendromus occidentalis]|uniref:Protein disulfide-isomerase n=1 Tax=Galendromus occidentalis TaxID=34638 RepID=A0AAJ6QML0_9ACAR|nr:protein disulfide-isomerase A3 [Galendromus occidentalis]